MTNHKLIVFDEFEKSQDILKNGFSSTDQVKKYEICLLAKYYVSIGIVGQNLQSTLIEFCKSHLADFNEIRYRNLICEATKVAKKYRLQNDLGKIPVTVNEMSRIKAMPKDYAKIAFVMLVSAKYNKQYPTAIREKKPLSDRYFCRRPIREILRTCKIPFDSESIMDIIYNAKTIYGIYSPSYHYPDNGMILIIDNNDNSPSEIIVDNINKILDFFPFYCEKCGKIIQKKNNRHKYCEECFKKNKLEYNRNRNRKIRSVL